jgi:hypothetical protein
MQSLLRSEEIERGAELADGDERVPEGDVMQVLHGARVAHCELDVPDCEERIRDA